MNAPASAIAGNLARIVPSMPFAEYNTHPALSRSTLDKIRRSPAHLKHAMTYGSPDNDAMRIGRNLHTLLLEPALFWSGIAIWEGGRRAGKAWEAFQLSAKAAGKEVVKAEELEPFTAIANAFEAKGHRKYLQGRIEHSIFWRDERTRLECKARPDIICGNGNLYDIKTTTDARANEFLKSAYDFGYHRQAAWYLDAFALTGSSPGEFFILALEKSPPYESQMFMLSHDFIALGRAENLANLDLFAECKRANRWPGYDAAAKLLTMPPWLRDMEIPNE